MYDSFSCRKPTPAHTCTSPVIKLSTWKVFFYRRSHNPSNKSGGLVPPNLLQIAVEMSLVMEKCVTLALIHSFILSRNILDGSTKLQKCFWRENFWLRFPCVLQSTHCVLHSIGKGAMLAWQQFSLSLMLCFWFSYRLHWLCLSRCTLYTRTQFTTHFLWWVLMILQHSA